MPTARVTLAGRTPRRRRRTTLGVTFFTANYYHGNTVGVRDVIPILTDGGSERASVSEQHVECRDCGSNLTVDTEQCPDCGGDIAVYDLS